MMLVAELVLSWRWDSRTASRGSRIKRLVMRLLRLFWSGCWIRCRDVFFACKGHRSVEAKKKRVLTGVVCVYFSVCSWVCFADDASGSYGETCFWVRGVVGMDPIKGEGTREGKKFFFFSSFLGSSRRSWWLSLHRFGHMFFYVKDKTQPFYAYVQRVACVTATSSCFRLSVVIHRRVGEPGG